MLGIFRLANENMRVLQWQMELSFSFGYESSRLSITFTEGNRTPAADPEGEGDGAAGNVCTWFQLCRSWAALRLPQV